jgi:hypothetical protein
MRNNDRELQALRASICWIGREQAGGLGMKNRSGLAMSQLDFPATLRQLGVSAEIYNQADVIVPVGGKGHCSPHARGRTRRTDNSQPWHRLHRRLIAEWYPRFRLDLDAQYSAGKLLSHESNSITFGYGEGGKPQLCEIQGWHLHKNAPPLLSRQPALSDIYITF